MKSTEQRRRCLEGRREMSPDYERGGGKNKKQSFAFQIYSQTLKQKQEQETKKVFKFLQRFFCEKCSTGFDSNKLSLQPVQFQPVKRACWVLPSTHLNPAEGHQLLKTKVKSSRLQTPNDFRPNIRSDGNNYSYENLNTFERL